MPLRDELTEAQRAALRLLEREVVEAARAAIRRQRVFLDDADRALTEGVARQQQWNGVALGMVDAHVIEACARARVVIETNTMLRIDRERPTESPDARARREYAARAAEDRRQRPQVRAVRRAVPPS